MTCNDSTVIIALMTHLISLDVADKDVKIIIHSIHSKQIKMQQNSLAPPYGLSYDLCPPCLALPMPGIASSDDIAYLEGMVPSEVLWKVHMPRVDSLQGHHTHRKPT